MSFSGDVKQELCRSENLQSCCLKAQTAGMLLFAKSFSAQKIIFSGSSRACVELVAGRLAEFFGVISEITVPLSPPGKKATYTLTVPDSDDRSKIVHYFSDIGRLTKKSCCTSSFIGGAFLACGTVTDPSKAYRLDFNADREKNALLLKKMLERLNITCGLTERGGNCVVYLNERETINDLLGYIGAVNAYWRLLNTAVERDFRNRATRVANCDNANISRTVDAAAAQNSAIKRLAAAGRLDTLDPPLRQAAELRQNNPEASLRELCELTDNTVARSTMNRRLARLVELADELK